MTKNEALQIAIDFLHGSYATHSVRKTCQEALEQLDWQGLTDDEIENARHNWERQHDYKHGREVQLLLADFARTIEQVLKEKNCENDNTR